MAIYHLHCQTIGREDGSAIAAAAYRATSRLVDRATGVVSDYSRKAKALATGIMAPEGSPDWVKDRGELWNRVQERENRKNSQFAWEYNLAIPHEIPNAEKLKLVRRFCSLFVEKGLIADYAIHRPDKRGDRRNLHAHVMVTTRTVTPEGWGEKFRIGENKMNDRREWLNTIRRFWEKTCNAELQRIGSTERIDCRTLEEQGIDRHPQQHQGPIATAMKRNGKTPDRKRTPIKQEFPQILITSDEINAAMNADPRTRKITIRQNLLNVPPDKWQEEMKKFDRYKQQPPKPSDEEAVEQYRLICGAVADVRTAKDEQARKHRIEQNRKKAQGQNWDSGWER